MSAEEIETPKSFTLIKPIKSGENLIADVTLQEPTAGDIEQLVKDEAKSGSIDAMVKLITKQTKIPAIDIRTLGARDFRKLTEYLGSFLPSDKGSSES